MNMGTLGMKGHKTQWASIIEAAYATKITLVRAAQTKATERPVSATRAPSRNQTDAAKNRATPAAAMSAARTQAVADNNRSGLVDVLTAPKTQTIADRNRAALAAALK